MAGLTRQGASRSVERERRPGSASGVASLPYQRRCRARRSVIITTDQSPSTSASRSHGHPTPNSSSSSATVTSNAAAAPSSMPVVGRLRVQPVPRMIGAPIDEPRDTIDLLDRQRLLHQRAQSFHVAVLLDRRGDQPRCGSRDLSPRSRHSCSGYRQVLQGRRDGSCASYVAMAIEPTKGPRDQGVVWYPCPASIFLGVRAWAAAFFLGAAWRHARLG